MVAAVLSLYVVAIHDPRVVGVGNFQSSTLLIIGIYPSRYHENKFSSIRSTGRKERRSAATSHTLGCCYCRLLRLIMMRCTTRRDERLLYLLLLHTTKSPAPSSSSSFASSSLFALLFGCTTAIFFSSYVRLLFAHVILLTSHTHTLAAGADDDDDGDADQTDDDDDDDCEVVRR